MFCFSPRYQITSLTFSITDLNKLDLNKFEYFGVVFNHNFILSIDALILKIFSKQKHMIWAQTQR